MSSDRISSQISFIVEIDKLKQVLRQTSLMDGSRRENDAEHSWHLAMMALVLAEHANEEMDLSRVVKMLLVHDVVEIDAGDTFLFDDQGNLDKAEREQRAADRTFGLLPREQAVALRALWDEFELRETPEARFASAIDRFQPLIQNCQNEGGTWKQFGIPEERVVGRLRWISDGSTALWEHARHMISEMVQQGHLKKAEQ